MKQLIGVGVGPGDPELVTVKAIRALRAADVILVPVLAEAAKEPGRAESIIREHIPDTTKVKRLEFALNDTGGVTPRRAAAWRKAAAAVADEFGAGAATIAFGTLGDPNLYSTFSYLAQTVRELVPGVSVTTIPGITAMQDLASRAGISLAEGTEPVTLVPLNAGPGALDQALAGGGAVVGYKVGAAASPAPHALRDMLRDAGRLEGAVIGARLGLPGELIAPATQALPAAPATEALAADNDIPDIPYLSTLIVPARRTPGIGSGLQVGTEATEAPAGTQVPISGPEGHHADRDDGPLVSPGRPRWTIGVVGRGAHPAGAVARGGSEPAGAVARGGSEPAGGAARGGGGLVSFVGAGPGAADLLTLRGAEVIAAADVVIWASSLVHPDVLQHAGRHARVVDSARLPMEGVLPYYQEAAARGLTIARVHSGDPSLWGAIQEQLEQCEALGLDTEVVPGVSSFTAVAARVKRELTIPEVAQSVILTRLGGGKTPMPPGERVAEFARHGTTMALFLSAARSGQLQDELLAGGYPPDTPCVVAHQVTWPDELILRCQLEDLAATIRQRKLWKHTLVLVGPGVAATAAGTRSHLYHPGHFHGYRKADHQARKQLRAAKDSP